MKIVTAIAAAILLSGCSTISEKGLKEQAGALEWSRRSPMNELEWHEVERFDFEDPAQLPQFKQVAGTWEIKDGKLWAVDGDNDRAIMLTYSRYNRVRIEFDAVNIANDNGLIGDITVLIAAAADKTFFKSGYALTTGSYWNQSSEFFKEGKMIVKAEHSPIRSGELNHVVVEKDDGHIRYWLNGKILVENRDDNPLPTQPSASIGLRTWATLMSIDNVVISTVPEK